MEMLVGVYIVVGIMLSILIGLLCIALSVKGLEWLATQEFNYEEEKEKEIIRKYEQSKK